MRRLSDLHERYGQDTPERAFHLAAGDAGAHVAYDRTGASFVLTFDDKESAEEFKKEYLDYEGVKVWRDDREGGDRFVITVDKETALQRFTPDPDAYARESVLDRLSRALSEDDSPNWPEAGSDGYDDAKALYSGEDVPDDDGEIEDEASEGYARRGGSSRRSYKKEHYITGFLAGAKEMRDESSRGEAVIDERTMTPAMQRTLDKVAAELASRVGEKVAKEMIQKYVAAGDEKGKAA